jgi:ankyrin repeat protein
MSMQAAILKITALHLASINKHLEIVQYLIEKRANVNAKDVVFENTALHFASIRGHFEIVQCLIANSADVNAKSKFYLSSLGQINNFASKLVVT